MAVLRLAGLRRCSVLRGCNAVQVRYIAICRVSGYLWPLGGLLAITVGGVDGGYLYDALPHHLFLALHTR